MVKTLLIGHTSGIGLEIFNKLENTIGVSKSTGFDVSTDISKDYDYSEYDCIILNAIGLEAFSQVKTFFNIIEHSTFSKEKLVIVMSSISAFKENLNTVDKIKYSIEKMSINKATRNLNYLGYNTSVICPSYVNTEWNKKRTDVLKLDATKVASLTELIYDNYFNDGVLINEMVFQQR
jgi:hypothetical protein